MTTKLSYNSVPHIVLFNGPPRSGKDTAHRALFDVEKVIATQGRYRPPFDDILHGKFSAPIKMAFAGMMGLEADRHFCVQPWESKKDEVIPALGVSYRQWQIDFSETFMKPLYGQNIFARMMVTELMAGITPCLNAGDNLPLFSVSDCGFPVEVNYLPLHMPDAKFLLIRLHRDGCTFEGDSREYVYSDAPNVTFLDIDNNGTEEEFQMRIVLEVKKWLGMQ